MVTAIDAGKTYSCKHPTELSASPAERLQAFKLMEESLVETDVVLIPIFYYGDVVAVKPYLERTFSSFDGDDFAAWRILRTEGVIPITGGDLESEDSDLSVAVSPNAFAQEAQLLIEVANALPRSIVLASIGRSYQISALDPVTGGEVEPAMVWTVEVEYVHVFLHDKIHTQFLRL